VFHLEARIHLQKVDALIRIIQDKFHGSCIRVTRLPGKPARHCAHVFAQFVINSRRRGFLNDFLVPSLDGTLSLPKVNNIAVVIGDNLYFDMADSLDVALHKKVVTAKGLA
jgi:hypothetical protein